MRNNKSVLWLYSHNFLQRKSRAAHMQHVSDNCFTVVITSKIVPFERENQPYDSIQIRQKVIESVDFEVYNFRFVLWASFIGKE